MRPLKMLFTEPIILLFSIYSAFVYGLLYLLFEAFPIAFEQNRHWGPVVSTLPFLGVLVGVLISAGLQASYQPIFWKQLDKALAQGKTNNPEARLPPMMLGGILFAAGLFVFGWTASPSIFWLAPIIGAVLIGMGFILIFQNAVNYLIDAFTIHAASAQAANTFFRSLAGAGFPVSSFPILITSIAHTNISSAFRLTHVREPRRSLGFVYAGLHCCSHDSNSILVLLVRCSHPPAQQIYTF